MPNAKDLTRADLKNNILLLGTTGSGKTSQTLTLPGKVFSYVFDPSALHTMVGQDIEYEIFVPEKLNTAAQSLTKGKGDPVSRGLDSPELYRAFSADIDKRVSSGYFESEVDWIVLDSFTTFGDLVMDIVMEINGRLGRQPQQDDYTAQMLTVKNVVKELVGQKCRVLCTAHVEMQKDDDSGVILNTIRLTGQLRTLIPLLFSDVFVCDVSSKPSGDPEYVIKTRKDRRNPQLRSSLRHPDGTILNTSEKVTIPPEIWKNPKGKAGLGKLILDNEKAK